MSYQWNKRGTGRNQLNVPEPDPSHYIAPDNCTLGEELSEDNCTPECWEMIRPRTDEELKAQKPESDE